MSTTAAPLSPWRSLAGVVRARLAGHDVTLYAAGVTLYLAVAVVPLLLVTIRLSGLLVGAGTLRALGNSAAGALPENLGARAAVVQLLGAGSRLHWSAALLSLLPASFYGEGLRRALSRLSGPAGRTAGVAWGRLVVLVILTVSPLFLLAILLLGSAVSTRLGDDPFGRVLGLGAAFGTGWVLFTPLLVIAYRAVAPIRPAVRPLLTGAAGVAGFLSGQTLSLVLFLYIPLNVGKAYGGFWSVGGAALVGGWIVGIHVSVLVGYVLVQVLDERRAAQHLSPAARSGTRGDPVPAGKR